MNVSRNSFNSLIFIFLFLSPHIVYSIIPSLFVVPYFLILVISYFLVALFLFNYISKKLFLYPFIFTLSFIFIGSLNLFVNNYLSFFNLISPIIAFLGFTLIFKKKLNLKYFDYVLLILYLYFYLVYFSILPDLFFRPGFDEDEAVFDNASSNAIPIALNMVLYSYFILNKFYSELNHKKIILFSIINIILILIQQSRVGIIVSLLLLFLVLFDYNKKYFFLILSATTSILISLIGIYFDEILLFLDVVGNINGLEALDEDIRGEAQKSFFDNMTLKHIFFGYPQNHVFAVGIDGEILYTYNVFLDIWNRYGFLQFIIVVLVLLIRVGWFRLYHFPIYYFIPFIIYSFVESLFFPNFWDSLIYLLIFTPKGFVSNFEERSDVIEKYNTNLTYGHF